jgi:hypothetical protein
MAAPDGTLTATAVQVDDGRMVVTLHALWRNRGPFAIELCSRHSIVEAFIIDPAPPLGDLQLQKGCHIRLLDTAKPSWKTYIMEPNTDSVMHQHFVVDDHFTHGFRWTIILGEYCLSNYILICFPIMLVVTKAIGREAWTPVRNARIHTWSRPGRPGANSASYVGAVAISLRTPRGVGDPCGKNRWPSFYTVTASQ